MKPFVFFILFLNINHLNAQIYGEIFMDKRPVIKDIDYTFFYSKEGVIVFEIAVNTKGDVTSCEIDNEKTTLYSTPMKVKARNRIMQELKFEAGNQYPTFHRGFVQIKLRPETE